MTGIGRAALRPLLVALTAYVAFMVLHVALAWDSGRFVTTLLPDIGVWLGPLNWAIYSVFALVLAQLWGWSRTGITRRPSPGWLRAAIVPIAAGLPFLLLGVNLHSGDLVPLILIGVPLIALNEELVFRGVILDMLRPLGLHRAVLGSALLFGLSHAANLLSGANPGFTAMQVAATIAGGVALGAIRIRFGSLWPVLFVHAVVDVIAIGTLTGPAISSPLLIPTLVLWLAANLTLWRFGWRLLGDPDARAVTRTPAAEPVTAA